MKLVIGGCAQGKLQFVLQQIENEKGKAPEAASYVVYDACLPDKEQQKNDREEKRIPILNHLHGWIKKMLISGEDPEQELFSFLNENRECIIICDEIGNGIVPIDPLEREYRERTGRILIEVAKQADEVVRVICGIGQKIK